MLIRNLLAVHFRFSAVISHRQCCELHIVCKPLPVVTCISLFFVAGYHSSWHGNGVPRHKPRCDGTDADGGHPREGFRIQLG